VSVAQAYYGIISIFRGTRSSRFESGFVVRTFVPFTALKRLLLTESKGLPHFIEKIRTMHMIMKDASPCEEGAGSEDPL